MFGIKLNHFLVYCLVISSLIISPNTLDQTLTIRLLFFSVFFLGISIYLKKIVLPARIITSVLLLQLLFVVFSFAQAINIEETLFENVKFFVFASTFILGYNLFKIKLLDLKSLLNFSIIVTCILASIIFLQFINRYNGDIYVLTGLNGHKNLAASFIFLLFIIKVSYLLSSIKSQKSWYVYSAVLLDISLILCLQSRGVWLGLIVSIIVFFSLYGLKSQLKRINYILLSVILLIILNVSVFLSLKMVLNKYEIEKTEFKFTKTEDQERVVLWKKTMQLIAEKPFLGHGGGNWQINFPKTGLHEIWRAEDMNVTFQRPHNDFLWFISEYGIVGFEIIAFFSMLIFSYVLCYSDKKSPHLLIIIAGLVGFYCFAFFDFPKERIEHSVVVFLLLGYILSNVEYEDVSLKEYDFPLKTVISVLLFVLTILSGIRYNSEVKIKKMHQNIHENQIPEIILSVNRASSVICSIDPYSMPLKWYSATAYATTNQNVHVFNELKEAYQKAPFNRNVLNDLGTIYTLQGKTEKAIAFYLKSHAISPRFDEPLLNLAIIYINLGKFEVAKYYMKQLLVNSPRREEIESVLRLETN